MSEAGSPPLRWLPAPLADPAAILPASRGTLSSARRTIGSEFDIAGHGPGSARTGLFVLWKGSLLSLTDILDEAAQTPPFERLLGAVAGPRRVFHAAGPGHAFVAAVLARTLDTA